MRLIKRLIIWPRVNNTVIHSNLEVLKPQRYGLFYNFSTKA